MMYSSLLFLSSSDSPLSSVGLSSPRLRNTVRWEGRRIGLLGGSFNPAHKGHLHIARLALAKFDLDFIWWMVTPQNPLKDKATDTAPYVERYASVERLISGQPCMMATHLEKELGTRYTYDTVKILKEKFPKTDFLFICGMDNALIFHKWNCWRKLTKLLPIVFIARPPAGSLVRNCPVRMFDGHGNGIPKGRKTDLSRPGTYWLETTRMIDISSSMIRNKLYKTKC